MHPELLKATVQACREYIDAGDCHGAPPPVERLIDAVVQLADALAAGVAPTASTQQREDIIRAAVAAIPNCNPGVADDLLEGYHMHTEADDLVAVWQAARGVSELGQQVFSDQTPPVSRNPQE